MPRSMARGREIIQQINFCYTERQNDRKSISYKSLQSQSLRTDAKPIMDETIFPFAAINFSGSGP